MSYCTASQYADQFGETELIQRTDRDRDGVADTGVYDRAAALADGEIDGYLAGRYQVPLTVIPPVVQRVAGYLTRYHLFAQGRTAEIREDYLDACKLLKNLSDGTARLGLPEQAAPATAESSSAAFDAAPRVFTSASLRDF